MSEFRDRTTGELKTRQQCIDGFNGALPKVWKAATYDALNVDPVLASPKPAPSSALKIVRRNGAVEDVNGNWVEAWEEIDRFETDAEGTKEDKDTAYLAAQAATAMQATVAMLKQRVQERLDAFAATRQYNSITSACTYATSTVQKFATEGQYCVQARDVTWGYLTQELEKVELGQRSLPATYEDLEPELPVLAWPE